MRHLPLKVTFQVSGGWVPPPYPFHLDALLAASVTQRNLIDLDDAPSIEALRALGEDLPLARHAQEGEWVWKASAIVPNGPVMNDSGFFTQRRNRVEYAEGVGNGSIQHGRHRPGMAMAQYQFQIDTLRGVHRNLLGYYPLQRPFQEGLLELVCWCVGDRNLIEELLTDDRRPTHLGARRRSGHGRIEFVQIEDDPMAEELWKRRVRPWIMLKEDVPIQAAWKAPYWAAENKGHAFVPVGL